MTEQNVLNTQATVTQEEPVASKTANLVPLLIVGMICMACGLAFLGYQNYRLQKQVSELVSKNLTPTEQLDEKIVKSSPSVESTDLLTFNEFPDFSFEYPKYVPAFTETSTNPAVKLYITTYKSESTGSGGGHYSDFILGINGPLVKQDTQSLKDYVEKTFPALSGYGDDTPTVTKLSTVNGKEVIVQTLTDAGATAPRRYAVYFITSQGNVYILQFENSIVLVESLKDSASEFDAVFKNILSSLEIK